VGIANRNKQKITSGIEEQGQRREPPRHGRQTGSRPAKAMVQTAQQIENNGDIFKKVHDEFLRADFFLAQQPAGEELGIAFIKISAKENHDGEVHGHKCPALPEFQCAGDKQKNRQRDLADQTPADQPRPETFGWWIFQSPKVAMFGAALPVASPRQERGVWRLPWLFPTGGTGFTGYFPQSCSSFLSKCRAVHRLCVKSGFQRPSSATSDKLVRSFLCRSPAFGPQHVFYRLKQLLG